MAIGACLHSSAAHRRFFLSSSEAGARVPRGHTGEEVGSDLRLNLRFFGFSSIDCYQWFAGASLKAVKELVERRKRLPHKRGDGRFLLQTRQTTRFFHGSSGSGVVMG